jgi:Protein phosphatase 2C
MGIVESLFRLLKLAPAREEPNVEPKPKRHHQPKKDNESNAEPKPKRRRWWRRGNKNDAEPVAAQRTLRERTTANNPLRRGDYGQQPIIGQVYGRHDRPQAGPGQYVTETALHRPGQPSAPHPERRRTDHTIPGPPRIFSSDRLPSATSDVISTTPVKRAVQPEGPGKTLNPAVYESPVFGSSPPAARRPWVLPVEPAVSGIAADQASIGDLDVRAVSIVGPGHRCEEPAMPRQDSYRLGRDRAGRYLIVAVADGMSDSRRSDLGATVASRCAVNILRAHLDRGEDPTADAMKEAFRTAAGAMVAAANNEGLSEMDVRCALIIAIIPSAPNAISLRRRAWFATLADVSAWLRHRDGWHRLAGDQKNDDFDRNALRNFLPYHPDRVVTVSYDLEPGATVAVVTDGIGDAFTEVPNAAQWFAQRWETPVPLESFLLDVGFQARGQLDDRTSVTVWCRDGIRSRQ